jgi:hypothetical protein
MACSQRPESKRSPFDGIKSPASRDALEFMLSPVLELNPRTGDEERHGCRNEQLAGLGVFENSRGDMDPDASNVVAAQLHLAGV